VFEGVDESIGISWCVRLADLFQLFHVFLFQVPANEFNIVLEPGQKRRPRWWGRPRRTG